MTDVETLAQLAREVAKGDPIVWGSLSMDEMTAYRLMAANVLEQFQDISTTDKQITLLATITKLLVENFVLNLKLMQTQDYK
jgi:hypothetical protein